MRSSPFGRLWRSKSLRIPAIALGITCALNMSGCHGGRRTSMRPRYLTSTTRSQSVVVDQGYTAVETPGAIVQQEQGAIIQQQQGSIIQQRESTPAETPSEPPIILEPRQGGTTSSVVPSFGDSRAPLEPPSSGVTSGLTPRKEESSSSVIDNLAPPAEAPQVIMEKPPMTNLDNTPKPTNGIDSTVKKPDPSTPEEPRLEVIPPGESPGGKAPAGSGGKEPGASKTSAWRTPNGSGSSSRITYQASSRKNVGSGQAGDPLGVID